MVTVHGKKTAVPTGTKGRILSSDHLVDRVKDLLEEYPGNYLEIGCYDGALLTTIAASKTSITCYGIDPFLGDEYVTNSGEDVSFVPLTEQKNNLYHNIASHDNVEFFEMTAEEFMRTNTQEELLEKNVSVCLVDGCHRYDYVVKDWKLALKLIGDKAGVIIFDDMHNEEVYRAFRALIAHLEQIQRQGAFGHEYQYTVINEEILSGPLLVYTDDPDAEALLKDPSIHPARVNSIVTRLHDHSAVHVYAVDEKGE